MRHAELEPVLRTAHLLQRQADVLQHPVLHLVQQGKAGVQHRVPGVQLRLPEFTLPVLPADPGLPPQEVLLPGGFWRGVLAGEDMRRAVQQVHLLRRRRLRVRQRRDPDCVQHAGLQPRPGPVRLDDRGQDHNTPPAQRVRALVRRPVLEGSVRTAVHLGPTHDVERLHIKYEGI